MSHEPHIEAIWNAAREPRERPTPPPIPAEIVAVQLSKLKRYDLVLRMAYDGETIGAAEMRYRRNGQYVKYDDVAALTAAGLPGLMERVRTAEDAYQHMRSCPECGESDLGGLSGSCHEGQQIKDAYDLARRALENDHA